MHLFAKHFFFYSWGLFSDVSNFEFDSDFQSMNGIDLVGARFQDWRALERARCIECVYQKVFLFRMHEKVTFGFAKHFLSTDLEFIVRSLQFFWKKENKFNTCFCKTLFFYSSRIHWAFVTSFLKKRK